VKKSVCLIARSIYPDDISTHTQNMKTFEGWNKFWNNIVIISQNNSDKFIKSEYKNIYASLVPLVTNKYTNIVYFVLNSLKEIEILNKQYNFDLFQASDPAAAIVAYIASKKYKKKFLFEVQGDIFDFPNESSGEIRSRIIKYVSKMIVKKADYIRIISPFLYEPLDRFEIDRKKIFIVPPRCDSKLFNKKRFDGKFYSKIDKSKKNILFIGNLTKAKGIDILLNAFSLILKKDNNIDLLIVGSGEEDENLQRQTISLGISKNVKFLGRIPNNEIPIVMNSVDVFVLPSIEEGMGRVLLESMAMELPVIASNVGGIPLLIEHNIDGLLFEVGNIKELSEYILNLLSDEELKNRLTLNANKKFIENYEYEVSMKMFIEMYKNIFEKKYENA